MLIAASRTDGRDSPGRPAHSCTPHRTRHASPCPLATRRARRAHAGFAAAVTRRLPRSPQEPTH